MKNSNLITKLAAGVTSAATAAVCAASAFIAPAVNMTASAAPDSDNYAKLLQYSLYLYDGNMCGDEVESKSGFSWRGNCHTGDAVPGGFHDCGDHVKFGITAGYSAATLGWSYMEYKDVFDELGQTGHLKLITDHFAKYFRDSTTLSGNTVTEFVYQIGDGGADHNNYWGPPEEQDQSSRKVFSTSNGASDIAAEYAAALAVNYINFGNEEDLKYAQALWNFSTKYNKCATDGVGGFYDSNSYVDDQAFAAGFLYLATKDDTYNSFLKSNLKDPNWIYCWDNVFLGASMLNGEINGDYSIVSKYASSTFTNADKWLCLNSWGAARYNTAAQFMGLLLTKNGKGDYSSWSQSQMGMILGENPKNVCLVVGYSDISAKYPHHEAASGLRGWGEYNAAGTTFGGKGHTLTGALEGGFQDQSFKYVDALNDIDSSEVGIDYNATLVAAAAGLYSIYKTGSIDSSVNGIDRNITYEEVGPVVTTTADPTATTTTRTTTTTVATVTREVEVTVPAGKTELEIDLNGADGISIDISADKGDIFNGAFSYNDTSGNYQQFGAFPNSSVDDSTGLYTLTESLKYVDAQNDTVTFHVWWSQNGSASIKAVRLIYNEVAPTSETTTASVTTSSVTETEPATTTQVQEAHTANISIIDADTGKPIPGVTFTLEGNGDWGAYFGKNEYTTADGVNEISLDWETIDDPYAVNFALTITAADGYIIPDSFPHTRFALETGKSSVDVEVKLSASGTKATIYGDANEDKLVNMADAVLIMQCNANPAEYQLTEQGKVNADVFGSGDGVTNNDALAIQRFEAGLYTSLPVAE